MTEHSANNQMKIQAQYLRKGDYLSLSKETVVEIYRGGLKVPLNKVELILRKDKANTVRTTQWNKTTEIRIERRSDVR